MVRSVRARLWGPHSQAADGHRGRCLTPRLEACTSGAAPALRSAVPARGHRPTPETRLRSPVRGDTFAQGTQQPLKSRSRCHVCFVADLGMIWSRLFSWVWPMSVHLSNRLCTETVYST